MALIGAAVVIAGIWLIWAWWDTDDDVIEDEYGVIEDEGLYQDEGIYQEEPEVGGVAQAGATVEQISENPAQYAGQRVTLSGEVGENLGQNAFKIEGNDPVFDASILVLDSRGMPIEVNEDQQVRVTGNVQMFQLAQLENDLGIDLEDNLFGEYEGQPVVIANSVQTSAQALEGNLETEEEAIP